MLAAEDGLQELLCGRRVHLVGRLGSFSPTRFTSRPSVTEASPSRPARTVLRLMSVALYPSPVKLFTRSESAIGAGAAAAMIRSASLVRSALA